MLRHTIPHRPHPNSSRRLEVQNKLWEVLSLRFPDNTSTRRGQVWPYRGTLVRCCARLISSLATKVYLAFDPFLGPVFVQNLRLTGNCQARTLIITGLVMAKTGAT